MAARVGKLFSETETPRSLEALEYLHCRQDRVGSRDNQIILCQRGRLSKNLDFFD